jgi:hypothetical protein
MDQFEQLVNAQRCPSSGYNVERIFGHGTRPVGW